MPIIFTAQYGNESSTAVQYERVQLSLFYLRLAKEYAENALKTTKQDSDIEYSLLSIILSALFLEAFANQLAEEFYNEEEIINFDRCRKQFDNPYKDRISNTAWKYIVLAKRRSGIELSETDAIIQSINDVIIMRHKLVHYKPQDTARKIHIKINAGKSEGGGYHSVIDFMKPPVKVEPSLAEKELNADTAAKHYHAARNLLSKWNDILSGEPSNMDAFPEISIN